MHDALLKSVFADRRMAEILIRHHAPEWATEIDFSRLRAESTGLVSKKTLQRRHPDMIWSADTVNGERVLVPGDPLPEFVYLILYHGDGPWSQKTETGTGPLTVALTRSRTSTFRPTRKDMGGRDSTCHLPGVHSAKPGFSSANRRFVRRRCEDRPRQQVAESHRGLAA